MLDIPREDFVPDALRDLAYVGEHLDIGGGRVLLDARVFAKMLDALDLQTSDLVLDVGTALGYSAAVIGRMTEAVVAIEEVPEMAAEAEAQLALQQADNVAVIEAPLALGAPQQGPYDAIVIEGGVEQVPQAILDQVKEGGRIAAVFMQGKLGAVRIGHKSGGHLAWRFAFNAAAPVLPGFAAAPAFVF
ncbi:MAG: protein-L-isoaspartate O-methyltransferase [Alphaproteobacteria bacterium HGW-Alphaproteobacteria-2]|nr:MAG: protein-L-isoaspartate O-methyltransferase [Alphaproteobacteria bacterium HGW-Alphaproteobacteria-2]